MWLQFPRKERKENKMSDKTMESLRAELEKKDDLLKDLEYIEYPEDVLSGENEEYYGRYSFCPMCGYKQPDGHWKDCRLGLALE